jgi:hypothetical protein
MRKSWAPNPSRVPVRKSPAVHCSNNAMNRENNSYRITGSTRNPP